MPTNTVSVNDYMRRLEELGEQEGHIGRFYVALHDEKLLDMEEQLTEAGDGMTLYQPVLDLYDRWKTEMGLDNWSEVWANNELLGDADKNWLLSEAMAQEFEHAIR